MKRFFAPGAALPGLALPRCLLRAEALGLKDPRSPIPLEFDRVLKEATSRSDSARSKREWKGITIHREITGLFTGCEEPGCASTTGPLRSAGACDTVGGSACGD